MFTREIVVESANFTVRPARQLFSLIFPEDQGLSDSDRVLGFGVRRVWDVSHFSRAARARARPLRGGSKDSGPIMPPVPSASGWGVMMLTIFGIMLLLISAAIAIRRLYHARLSV